MIWSRILTIIKNILKGLTLKDFIYLGIIVFLFILYRSCQRPSVNTVISQPVLTPVVPKTDKKGNNYSEIQGTLYTESQMKAVTDSFRKVLGKGKVTQVTRTITDIDTVLKQDTLYVDDRTGEIYIADSERYIQLSYHGNWKADTGSFHFTLLPDTATSVTTVQKRLFRANRMTLNIYHTNPLFIPKEGYTFQATVPKVISSIGPAIGVGYTINGKFQPFIGVAITLNLIGLKRNK